VLFRRKRRAGGISVMYTYNRRYEFERILRKFGTTTSDLAQIEFRVVL
jgi:hypothetical protein